MSANDKTARRKIALLAPVLLLVAACGGHEPASPEQATLSVRAPLAQVERLEVPQHVELFGSVEAEKTAAVSARVMARVTAVRVRAGDRVRHGQLLLAIDPEAAQGQLAQAQGALAQARAALALAERNYERFKGLAGAEAASELELDLARMQHDQAQGAVQQAEGAVAAASSVASDSSVVAPFSGRVVRKMVEVGDLAAPGRPLLLLESDGDRRMVLKVPESVMARAALSVGDELAIAIDTRPDFGKVPGSIVEKSPGADPGSHSFEIRVALPLADIASGSSGRAWVEVDRRTVVAVPAAAVLRQGGLSLVVVRTAEGRSSSRVVTLGETLDDGRIEVLSGLDGDEVVALDLAAVPPADTVLEETKATEESNS